VDKNRNGENRTITLRAHFEEGRFEVTDAPYITKRNDELERLAGIIGSNPGLSQNSICKASGMAKARCIRLLQEGKGKRWKTEKCGQSIGYFGNTGSDSENYLEPVEPVTVTGSAVLSSSEENREPVPSGASGAPVLKTNGKDMTQCAACQSYAVYREKDGRVTCMTCDAEVIH